MSDPSVHSAMKIDWAIISLSTILRNPTVSLFTSKNGRLAHAKKTPHHEEPATGKNGPMELFNVTQTDSVSTRM